MRTAFRFSTPMALLTAIVLVCAGLLSGVLQMIVNFLLIAMILWVLLMGWFVQDLVHWLS